MQYQNLATKVQNDSLGPAYLNAMRSNIFFLRTMLGFQHLTTGEHNAREVPRACRRITNTPTVSPASSDITAVTNPAVGQYTLTLAANRFDTDIRLQVQPIPESAKPLIATYTINSATSVDVYVKKLTSTLGVAGNTWGAVNTKFDIAIHGSPLAQTSWNGLSYPWLRAAAASGYGLVGGGSNSNPSYWSAQVRAMADLQTMMLAEHTSAGVHNTRQVAKYAGRCWYDSTGPKYSSTAGAYSFVRTGVGVIEVSYTALTAPVSAFVCPDFARYSGGADVPIIVNTDPDYVAGTKTKVTIYKWNAGSLWWEPADADFFLAIHGS